MKIYDLHRFSDGNPKAYVYGACVYLPTIKLSGEVNVKLVAAKPRVSPLNPHTIPRTELLENLLLVSLMNSIKKALESQVTISDHFYWTSSTVSLWWIKEFDKEYKTFVQNGVIKIHELSNIEKWNYVKSNSNPLTPPSVIMTYCVSKSICDSHLNHRKTYARDKLFIKASCLPERETLTHFCFVNL